MGPVVIRAAVIPGGVRGGAVVEQARGRGRGALYHWQAGQVLGGGGPRTMDHGP